MLVAASRETHEGFAMTAQLLYIMRRFPRGEVDAAVNSVPLEYRDATGLFAILWKTIEPEPRFDSHATMLAVRAFAIAALNIDILHRVSFTSHVVADLADYLHDPQNNPDARLRGLIAVAEDGKLGGLLPLVQALLARVTEECRGLEDRDARESLFFDFSRTVNETVLRHFSRRLSVDLTLLDESETFARLKALVEAAAAYYNLDPAPLLGGFGGRRSPNWKRHAIEFSDRAADYSIAQLNLDSLAGLMRDGQTSGVNSVATLIPLDATEERWLATVAMRSEFTTFSAEASTYCAIASLSELLAVLSSCDTRPVILDVILNGIGAVARDAFLQFCSQLYIYCGIVSIANLEEEVDRWLGSSDPSKCNVTLLRRAIDHHSIVIMRPGSGRIIMAVIDEYLVGRYEYYLSRRFTFESRDIDLLRDAVPLLVAWSFTYGPSADVLKAFW